MRMEEILEVRVKDFMFNSTISAGKQKNDQHRDGHEIAIVESVTVSWPVFITRKLIGLLGDEKTSEFPIMRRIVIKKGRQMLHPHLGISYTTARDNFERNVAPFVEDIKRYGTHSIKSGATSNLGCRELNGIIDKHAGWRNTKSKQRYKLSTKQKI